MTTVTIMGMIFSSDNVPDFGSIRLTKKRYNNVNDYIFKVEDLSKLSLITNAAEGSTALATDTGDLYILHMGLWSILGGESEENATNAVQNLSMSPLNINRGELTGGVNLEDETEIESEAEESEEPEVPEVESTPVEEMR